VPCRWKEKCEIERCEDVKMRKCEDEKMLMCEDDEQNGEKIKIMRK